MEPARHHAESPAGALKDPVCGMPLTPDTAAESHVMSGRRYYFCSAGCAAAFCADPPRYGAPGRAEGRKGAHVDRPRGDYRAAHTARSQEGQSSSPDRD